MTNNDILAQRAAARETFRMQAASDQKVLDEVAAKNDELALARGETLPALISVAAQTAAQVVHDDEALRSIQHAQEENRYATQVAREQAPKARVVDGTQASDVDTPTEVVIPLGTESNEDR